MTLSSEEFETLTQEIFDSLPEQFQHNMENVRIVIEDFPSNEILVKMGTGSANVLLGLYEGIPLNKRGTWYGMYPVVPDKISLYKNNIERTAHTHEALCSQIRKTLVHEIAHYYGMDEDEVRAAGY
jgi:predicted Zn-dependent protease with MMP-like domain